MAIIRKPTIKAAILSTLPDEIERQAEGGLRFSQRQLFYGIRPAVHRICGRELEWDHFTKVLADHEREEGLIPGLYRDVRGSIYHPHDADTIPLGTLSIETYKRPSWTFANVLYIEKEGLASVLIESGWPELHDCAIVSSKGQATAAAKDLLDLLADHPEPVRVFCVHDADGPGTCIFEALQYETRARAARKVAIVNLGLEADEAVALGLALETIETKSKKVAVASYVEPEWRAWYQRHRVELNAFRSTEFVAWLNRKIGPYSAGKVIPPADDVQFYLRSFTETTIYTATEKRIRKEARIEERARAETNAAMKKLEPAIREASADLMETMPSLLKDSRSWWVNCVSSASDALVSLPTTDVGEP